VRVDASARSLRHGWLDAGVTGLQILVASEYPNAATLAPYAEAPVISTEEAAVAAPGAPRRNSAAGERADSATSQSLIRTEVRPRPRVWSSAVLGAGTASLALLVATLVRSATAPPVPPAPVATEETRAAAVAADVVKSASAQAADSFDAALDDGVADSAPGDAVRLAAEPLTSAASSAAAPAMASDAAPVVSPGSAAAPRGAPRVRAPAKQKAKAIRTEFGF